MKRTKEKQFPVGTRIRYNQSGLEVYSVCPDAIRTEVEWRKTAVGVVVGHQLYFPGMVCQVAFVKWDGRPSAVAVGENYLTVE